MTDYDVIVIGSGFGGSVVGYRLASDRKSNVCILERGREYGRGSFPRGIHEFERAFWDPGHGLLGLFECRSFENMDVLVSSGLGGGSLIYANVLIEKPAEWFKGWPSAITRSTLDPYYSKVVDMLEAKPYPFNRLPYSETRKTAAVQAAAARVGRGRWFLPKLALTYLQSPDDVGKEIVNKHGAFQTGCIRCGECNVGCNYHAKNTLDLNYLFLAKKAGVSIRVLHQVDRIESLGATEAGYRVHFLDYGESRPKQGSLTARKVVLAAGCLGSTELLLRNRDVHRSLPKLSKRLGHGFSGNGDFLSACFSIPSPIGPVEPTRGPVITCAVEYNDQEQSNRERTRGFYIEDAGLPDFLGWYAEGLIPHPNFAGVRFLWKSLLRRLGLDCETRVGHDLSKLLASEGVVSRMLPLLGMGRDMADGRISLTEHEELAIEWSMASNRAFFDDLIEEMRKLCHGLDATFLVNPTWNFGKLITVHPLGGCIMADSAENGVVDDRGRVFGYENLYVADGSIIPTAVGPNPCLTIAALAERIAEKM